MMTLWDFMFQLSPDEAVALMSQNATLKPGRGAPLAPAWRSRGLRTVGLGGYGGP